MKRSDVEQMKKAWSDFREVNEILDTGRRYVEADDIACWLSAIPVDEENKIPDWIKPLKDLQNSPGTLFFILQGHKQERARCMKILEEMLGDGRAEQSSHDALVEVLERIRDTRRKDK